MKEKRRPHRLDIDRKPRFGRAHLFTLFCIEICLCMGTALAVAKDKLSENFICKYGVMLDGKRIGQTEMTRRKIELPLTSAIRIETATTLQVKGLLGMWTLDSRSVVEQDQGGITSFDHKITDDGQKWHLFGEKYKQSLWCSARKVQTKKEKDEEDTLALVTHVATRTIPYAGETLMVLNLLDSSNDEQGDVAVPLDTFDTSLSLLPLRLLAIQLDEKKKLRILDTTELKIAFAIVSTKGDDQVTLAGHQFNCRVFEVKAKESKSTYWVAQDTLGAFIVKEQGKNADGPFELTLEQYE